MPCVGISHGTIEPGHVAKVLIVVHPDFCLAALLVLFQTPETSEAHFYFIQCLDEVDHRAPPPFDKVGIPRVILPCKQSSVCTVEDSSLQGIAVVLPLHKL